MKKFKVLGSVALLGLMLAGTASAAEFIGSGRTNNNNVTLSSSETHKNLYVAGGSVTIDSNITGDLFAAGGMVTVNGNVEKDLFVGGGNVSLNGTVGDSLRVGAGNVTINSPVGGDLLVGAGNVTVTEKSSIKGDLIVGGGNVVINSPVSGNVKIAGGSVTINSKVSGSVEVRSDKDLTFGPSAVVAGVINYKGPQPATVQDGAQVSMVNFTMVAPRTVGHKFVGLLTIAFLIKLFGLFAAAWCVNKLFPGKFQSLTNHIQAKPWHNFGIGVAALFATPFAAVILMVTVIGLYLGVALLAAYVLVLLVAAFLMPYYVGAQLIAWYKKSSTLTLSWPGLVYGLLAVMIVGMIPVIGWIPVFIVYCMSIGALVAHVIKQEASVTL